jgi:hypothetical protein
MSEIDPSDPDTTGVELSKSGAVWLRWRSKQETTAQMKVALAPYVQILALVAASFRSWTMWTAVVAIVAAIVGAAQSFP